jgi:hypothetical protein
MNNIKFKDTEIENLVFKQIGYCNLDGGCESDTAVNILQRKIDSVYHLHFSDLFEIQISAIPDLLGKDFTPILKLPENIKKGHLYIIENSPWLKYIKITDEHKEEVIDNFKRRGNPKTTNDYKHYYLGSEKEHIHMLALSFDIQNPKTILKMIKNYAKNARKKQIWTRKHK